MNARRVGRSSVLALVAASLSALLPFVTAYADAYDTTALATSPQVYLAMNQTSSPFTDTASGDACTWHSALATHAGGPGSASHSGNFTNYSYCELGSSYAMGSTGSLSFWFENNSSGSIPDDMPVIDFCVSSSTCGSSGEIRAYIDVANKLCFAPFAITNVCGSTYGSGHFSDFSAWHFWAITWSGTTVKFYYDGALDTTQILASAPTSFSSTNGLVGARWANGDFLTGYVARWMVQANVLSSTDVSNLFAATTAGPPAHLTVTPGYISVLGGFQQTFTVQSVDATGTDVSGSGTYTVDAPFGWTCDGSSTFPHSITGTTTTCIGSVVIGTYTLTWHDTAHSLTAFTLWTVSNTPNSFALELAAPPNPYPVGEPVPIRNNSHDAAGSNVSIADPWTVVSSGGGTCTAVFLNGSYYESACSWSSPGTYTVTGKETALGFTATVTVVVVAASSATTCGSTDLGCWLNQVWDAVTRLAQIPGQIIAGVSDFLLVSSSGKSYIDTSVITSGGFLPQVDCRSGQTPTAPDSVHCFPFPISLPFDVQEVFNLINVSPTAPSFSLSWTFTFMGSTIPVTHTFDVSAILTDTLMSYVRGAELVIFIIGTAFGTWRFVNLVGAI